MKLKKFQLRIFIFVIIILIFVVGCSQKEEVTNNLVEVPFIVNEEIPKWNISNSLKLCLQENVYGKDDNWVDLAENHCKQLLPDSLMCLFGNTKVGTFGVLCTTPEKISNELDYCLKKNVYGCTTDSDCIYKSNNYCWSYLASDCKFGPIGVYCLIYS